MNKKLRFSLLMLLMAVFSGVWADSYVKVTSTANITNGTYLIVYETNGVAFDGSLTSLDAVSNTVDVTIANGEIEATDELDASAFTIDVTAGTLKSASGYYIGKTANANGLDASASNAFTNTFAIDGSGNAVITASGGTTMRFNKAVDQNRFRYYKTGQQAIQLYKKVSAEAVPVATNVSFEPLSVLPGSDGMYTVSVTYAEGATGNVSLTSSDEDVFMMFTSGDHIGEFIAGSVDGSTATVTVTVTPTGDNAANFTAVTETFEVVVEDPRTPVALDVTLSPLAMELDETGTFDLNAGLLDGCTVTLESADPTILSVSSNGTVDFENYEDAFTYEALAAGKVNVTVTFEPMAPEDYKPVSKTFEITITDPNGPGTENNPFTVAQALEFINGLNGETSDEVYVKGIVSTNVSISGGNGTYWLSDTGSSSDLQVYKGRYQYDRDFDNTNTVNVGDIVVVKGTLKQYNSTTPQFNAGNVVVQHIIRTPIATISGITPTELTVNSEGSFGVTWQPADGTNTPDYEMTLSTTSDLITIDSQTTFNYTTGSQAGTATITVTVTATDQEHYSNVSKDFTVTISAEPIEIVEPVIGKNVYKKVTSNDELVAGHRYLLVYDGYASAGEPFVVFNGMNGNIGAVADIANTVVNSDNMIDARNVEVVPVVLQGATGTWLLQVDDQFLAYTGTATSGNNNLYTVSSSTANGALWNIDVNGDHFITNLYNTVRVLQYNINSPRFACYVNGSQKDAVLYVELTDDINEVKETEALALADDTYEVVDFTYTVKAGWNTIALPFDDIDIKDMFGSNVKLYQYNGMNEEGLQFSPASSTQLAWGNPYVFYLETAPENNVFTFANIRIYPYPENVEEFQATYEPMSMAGKYGVVPTTGEIKKGGPNSTIKAFRGYFDLPAESGDAVQAVFHNEDGTTTAIKAVELFNETNGNVYDLSGRKVSGNLQPGVYVKDGKKVVVK